MQSVTSDLVQSVRLQLLIEIMVYWVWVDVDHAGTLA